MRPLSRCLVAVVARPRWSRPSSPRPRPRGRPSPDPRNLPRGADVSIPHLEGKTIVDGAIRVRVKAPTLRLLGKSGASYVVGTANGRAGTVGSTA